MRLILTLSAILFLGGCGTNPGKAVPREAANAMVGSPETITAIVGLAYKGSGTVYEIAGEVGSDLSTRSTVPLLFRAMSFRRGQWRQNETLIPDLADSAPYVETTGLDGQIAFDLAEDGTATRLSEDEAQLRRAELYHHPLGYLFTVFFRSDPPLNNTRVEDNMEAVDMTVDGVIYTLYIDSGTKLPVKIVSEVHHPVLGDVEMESSFDDYVDVHGHNLPAHITRKLDGRTVADFRLDQQFSGPDLPNLEAPPALDATAAN